RPGGLSAPLARARRPRSAGPADPKPRWGCAAARAGRDARRGRFAHRCRSTASADLRRARCGGRDTHRRRARANELRVVGHRRAPVRRDSGPALRRALDRRRFSLARPVRQRGCARPGTDPDAARRPRVAPARWLSARASPWRTCRHARETLGPRSAGRPHARARDSPPRRALCAARRHRRGAWAHRVRARDDRASGQRYGTLIKDTLERRSARGLFAALRRGGWHEAARSLITGGNVRPAARGRSLMRHSLSAAILVCATVLAACAPTTSSGPSPTSNQPNQPKKGGTLILARTGEVTNLDPHKVPAFTSARVFELVYSYLMRLDENLGVQPDLAESVPTTSADGKTVTVKLRTGVKFHNGDPLTSADVKYTFDRIIDTKTAAVARSFFADVDTITAPDPATVIFNLKNPNAALIAYMAHPNTGIVSKKLGEANADLSKKETA